jgi:hypothetical protein
MYDDRNSLITKIGTWTLDSSSSYYNSTSSITSTSGATIKFNFIGTSLQFIGWRYAYSTAAKNVDIYI